jgi:ATP-dependent protease HslVU (ClpYQ) peptidase subunit
MTCIAALIDGKKVIMGGDSAGVAGLSLSVRKDRKVFKRKDHGGTIWLFGFTSSFRMGELIQFNLRLPAVKADEKDLYKFMVTKFIPALRSCLKKGGWAKKDKEQEKSGFFLVGLKGRIFHIQSDYQVAESIDPYYAVGCGDDLALGSLYTSQNEPNPKKRIQLALEAAQKFSAGVREPFVIISS